MTSGVPDPEQVSALVHRAARGDRGALDALLPVVYAELRQSARRFLRRERRADSVQATALVHDVYLRLVRDPNLSWQNQAHFRAIAANAMRQILVERARARHAAKRGGGADRITLDERLVPSPPQPVDVVALDTALTRLAAEAPREARVVELRFFGGLTVEETAVVLDVAPATVKRDWVLAKAWLRRALGSGGPDAG